MAIWGRPAAVGHQTTPLARRDELRREYLWNTPDGDKPDFFETYTHGDIIPISWNALNHSIYDLWLTSWDMDVDPVVWCLQRGVNLAHDGHFKLATADPPIPELADETGYVLRFKPPTDGGKFVASDPGLSSPGFLLVQSDFNQQDVPGTTASSTPTASPTGATPSRTIATSVAESDEPIQDISPGAAAGLTIGLIFFVGFLVAIEVAYLMWWRKRRRGAEEDGETTVSSRRGMLKRFGKSDRGLFVQVDKAEMVIDDSMWMSPELPGDSTWGQRLVHELKGSRFERGSTLGRTLTVNSEVVELEAGRDR